VIENLPATTAIPAPVTAAASWWDELPAVDEEGAGLEVVARAVESAAPRALTRRRVMQVGLTLGGAVALNALQVLAGVKLRRASATVGTEYLDCARYDNWSGYNNNSLVCVGFPYSYIYCGSDGWFKNGYFDGGTTQYRPVQICGTGGLSARNAWRWPHGQYRYRCADGQFRYIRNGTWTAWVYRICSQWIGYR